MGKKRKPNKAERDHMGRVAELGCIACYNMGYPDTPASIHHIRADAGAGQRASHYHVLPLCPHHHQHGGLGEAIHAGQETWEGIHGTERELLARVRGLLGYVN